MLKATLPHSTTDKKPNYLIFGLLGIGLLLTGIVVYKVLNPTPVQPPPSLDEEVASLPQVDASVTVALSQSTVKDNTIVIKATGLKNMASIGYELTFESNGVIQGVTSGNKPVEVVGKDSFEREVYLGTCSKNVCRPYPGVKKVSLVLEFIDTSGKKSQFSKDYDL